MLAVLIGIAIHSYVDQFEVACTRSKGIIITHKSNVYCVRGHKVLAWVIAK